MADVRDILEIDYAKSHEVNKGTIMGIRKESTFLKKKKEKDAMKRPEGMHRELYALLYSSDGPKDLPPLLPSDADKSYKSVKAKLGMKKVRPWEWMPFVNPARTDDAVFYHWRRVADKGKDYPFATFNKKVDILTYTDEEYNDLFSKTTKSSGWTKVDTDLLFDLCQRFDLRWPVIQDRWPPSEKNQRSIEDLKTRYYEVTNQLKKHRNLTGPENKIVHYDVEHERRRKEQLIKLYNRTPKQMEEEKQLQTELRKIESRKKERERKTHDLQKLISASDPSLQPEARRQKIIKKKLQPSKLPKLETSLPMADGSSSIKFPDLKTSGVSLRSHRMKLPTSVGQKKAKAIEQLLIELGLDLNPIPIEEVCQSFNDLRSNLILMYDLRTVLLNYMFELQTLKHQYETFGTGKALEIPEMLSINSSEDSPSKPRGISEVIDSVASPNTPNRKRRAALEQSNILRKIKARN